MKIHSLADVQATNIGKGTIIWQYSVVLQGAVIGENCNINCHTFIENDVVIGNNVTIKSGVYLWDGLRIEDNVFIGPNAMFTNDLRPRSKQRIIHLLTKIKEGASIGASSTVLAGTTIGRFAMTGIGSVITHNVPDHALVFGNPARVKGWVDEKGEALFPGEKGIWISKEKCTYYETETGLKRI